MKNDSIRTYHRAASPAGVAAVICAFLSLSLAGCGDSKPQGTVAQAPEVEVVTVHRQAVPVRTELPGRTVAYLVAQVRARVDGIVLKREFEEGSDVKANQLLYRIDPAPYRAALDSAQASLQNAQARLVSATALAQRDRQLIAANAVSKQDLDNAVAAQGEAEAMVASGKAAVETARINLGYTDVVSPISGRVGISQVTQGAYVQAAAATLLSTVQQLDPIYVDLNRSSLAGLQWRRDIVSGTLRVGGPDAAKVQLTLEDGSQYPLAGKLEFTDVTVDSGTGSVTVRAVFPNPDHVLLPGMFVRASIEQGVDEHALLVPQVGVTHDPKGQATVLVVGDDDKVALRTIQATRTSGDQWVVDGGLEDGEKVIVAGLQKVKGGALVRTVEKQPPAASAGLPGARSDRVVASAEK
ncbi:efflux RND transporter periplasmic adaptor subunit [Variovorax ginsengisoli]|uniref:Efflux RND transporter periplasmic adaptor subunit n=1 Tax=Variovorax ginsengisoli TaxID=363844 RepID=A0ABT8SDK9_9BURK|nr:efflux RND transporter periplasmic adaptor subunit [Variovorax ginsengisoli]MDN8617748.1 efflux RND transporter periplasmic adaptor subunit [Variovorax ginsengisoli]MDO1536918.1 efflux RND transporter periplasmic adaptor subunit [Variovorax ginsengisoli]